MVNPNGIPPQSPGLRVFELPWVNRTQTFPTLKGLRRLEFYGVSCGVRPEGTRSIHRYLNSWWSFIHYWRRASLWRVSFFPGVRMRSGKFPFTLLLQAHVQFELPASGPVFLEALQLKGAKLCNGGLKVHRNKLS